MPFALIPEGYKLQKVTKLQKEAVDKFYSSKNIDSFLDGQASGELVKAVAIVVTPIVLAALAKQVDLPDFNITEFIDELLDTIHNKKFKFTMMSKIKELLYNIYCFNYPIIDVIKYMLKNIIKKWGMM